MNKVYKKLFGIFVGLAVTGVAYAASPSLSDWPLESQSTGAYPNVLFIVDDSGSMADKDVFYAPGYDNDNIYSCTGGTVIAPVAGQALQINVVKSGTKGMPYFIYNGVKYGWGPSGTAQDETGSSLSRACFVPNAEYLVKFKDYKWATLACKSGFTLQSDGKCYDSSKITDTSITYATCSGTANVPGYSITNSSWSCWKKTDTAAIKTTSKACSNSSNSGSGFVNVYFKSSDYSPQERCGKTSSKASVVSTGSIACPSGFTAFTTPLSPYSTCEFTTTAYIPKVYEPSSSTETQKGNFLNWYLSATVARYSSGNLLPGYAGYTAAGALTTNDTGLPWTQTPADDFALSTTTQDVNSSPKVYGQYVGNKPLVHWNHQRLEVAQDIGKIITRKITNVRLALADFWTIRKSGTTTYTTSGVGNEGWLLHEFADLSIESGLPTDSAVIASKTRADANKQSLITQWDIIKDSDYTPTGSVMARMARYFFQGWEDETFAYFNKLDAATAPAVQTTKRSVTNKKINEILTITPQATTYTKKAYENTTLNTGKILTKDRWCEKNAMAVLTDGVPTKDSKWKTSPSPLGTYDTYGTSEDGYESDSGIIRVPGALYDHDWIPTIEGKQNIESFFIAFGDVTTINAPVFDYAGFAGGGGAANSYPATSGTAVLDAFKAIIQRVSADNLGISAVAVSSTATLKQKNYAFQSTYNTEFYTTNLYAINLNINGEFTNPDGSNPSRNSNGITPLWNAGALLNSKYVVDDISPAPDVVRKRLVYTWNAAKSGTKGMRFGSDTMTRPSTPASSFAEFTALPANLQYDLDVVATGDAQQRYDLMMFLLGDAKNEKNHPSVDTAINEKYRQRGVYSDTDNDGLVNQVSKGGIFADSVNSSPIFVKEPLNPLDDLHYGTTTNTYSKFKAMQVNRTSMLYVGANDGFLHAISVDAVTKNARAFNAGDELFAYMPTLTSSIDMYRGLHFLAMPEYNHLMYVDQTPTIRDAFVDLYSASTPFSPEWRSMLIGGLGKGGKGYYALDVTCPVVDNSLIVPPGGSTAINNTCSDESFNEKNILWEFSDTNDVDMGYSFSRPIIAKVQYSTGLAANNDRLIDNGARWAMITGNGYNSTNGRAALYIIFLDGGLDGVWTAGTDYIKIYANDSSLAPASADTALNSNGLSSPTAVDVDNDGAMDRVYAGDLKGHMWVFDLSTATNNTSYALSTFPWKPKLLFTTGKDASTPQPITTPPVVQRDLTKTRILPNTPAPDLMVMFGTGQYLGIPDLTDLSVQTLYAVHDRGTYNLARYKSVPSTSLKQLEPRIFTEAGLLGKDGKVVQNRLISGNNMDPAQFGWYVDYASDIDKNGVISGKNELVGERLATDMARLGPTLLMNTTLPVSGSCTGSTQSYSIYVDWTTGLEPKQAFYDANNDGLIDSQDLHYVGQFNSEGAGQITIAGTNVISQSGGDANSGKISPQTIGFSQRIGWEEKLPYGLKGQ